MIPQLTSRLLYRAATATTNRVRLFSTQVPETLSGDNVFAEAWKKVSPNIDPPKTPLSFMQPRPPAPSSIPSKLTVNFVLPYASELSNKEPPPGIAFFSTQVPEALSGDNAFVEAWKKVAPNIDPPKTPLSFMQPCPPAPSSIPSKLTVNFVLPYASEFSNKEVDMVIVPATTGQMGILPGHVPTIAELKPGLLSVHEGNDVKKYFVSSGFAFVHTNSYADIIAVEAVPIDQIDTAQVQKGFADFTQKLGSASTESEKAEAQIGVDVHSALNAALTG